MKKVSSVVIVSLFLGTLLATTPLQAAVQAGTKCGVLGQVKNSQGKKFTCIKSGKKLVWSKGQSIKATVSKPATQPVPLSTSDSSNTTQVSKEPEKVQTTPAQVVFDYSIPSVKSDSVNNCKIKDVSKTRGMTGAGFPEMNSMTPRFGKVKWALIPIDFPDLKGEVSYRKRVDEQMRLLSEWYETVSEGKFIVEWVVADKWVTLPKPSTEYLIGRSVNVVDAPNGPKLFKDAMTAADPNFDFTGIQTVNFILPLNQNVIDETSQGFPWDAPVKEMITKEGAISSYSIPGNFFDVPGKTYWAYWAHEFGHAIGLPHIGTARGESPPFHALDIMGNQDGPDKELSGWIRFYAGWLSGDQVFCKDSKDLSEIELTLVPLSAKESGVKLAVIPLNATKALLIESRRVTKFSCTTPTKRDGVLVYTYDATLGHGEDFLVPHPPASRPLEMDSCNSQNYRSAPPVPDLLLHQGEKVTVEGITVEVLLHGNFDKVKVIKK